jgi:amino acid adenylation domain-containing protein
VSIAEFISDLRTLDIRLSVNGQRLRVNAPKGVLTDSLRAQIAERKQELLQFLSDYKQPAFISPPILRRTISDPAPLSFAQERLWFLEQFEPGSAVYNICRASRLTGKLNIAALEASLTEILRRHEILRSKIGIVDGRPFQVTMPVSKIDVPVIDLRSLAETEGDRGVRDRIKVEAERRFDFSAGLFLRAVLLQISNDEHILILTTHHIVADAWSMGILTRELWTLYDAYANRRPSPLQDPPVRYADYAVWQREWLQKEALEAQLSYWRKQLVNLPVLSLPTNHPRPEKQSFRGARQPLSLPESLTKAVNELSGREGATQFMTLLAAFQVLLYRYSGQEDVVIGLPIANRNRTEIEVLIGFFVNTLVLRTELSEKPTFKELLQRVRNVCLEAYAHQDMPFEKLVEELRPERDVSRNPLFQVMFIMQNAPRPLPQMSGISFERIEIETERSAFDLALCLRERDEKLIGYFEYANDLFDASTIERMVGHFKTLLEGIVANPDQPITILPILTDSERHQLLVEWNDTAAEYPKDSCIHELFEAQVERAQEAIAVQFDGKQLTYRELNARANQLAHYLRQLGVGPEKLVGICVERSLEMVVGLLGILKAGGAYVPLDPSYPRERLAFMLEDAGVSVLLTEERLIKEKKSNREDHDTRFSILDPQLKVVCLDRDREKIAQQSDRNPLSQVHSGNLAYVIYTSGSTGQPKGVQISQRSVINCLHSIRQLLCFTEKDILLAVTTISFDIAALEVYLPLIIGARVALASRDDASDGEQLLDRLSVCGATAMQATPSTWRLLLDAGWEDRKQFKILCGGEALPIELAEQLVARGSLWNLYGPTETTIWSTLCHVKAGENSVPIGRPIANTRIYILNSGLEPSPIGVSGEICVGGDGLARGYLNRPNLTSEKFIPNPFSFEHDAKLYRTGDLARYLPDGNIEFVGRIDNQVKIHGHRIELGEIEAMLNQHPAVRECIVVAQDGVREEDWSGAGNPKSHRRLVVYVLSHTEQPTTNELRDFLKDKLPDYMVPSAFVMVRNLPLTPNGKVDRRNLPRPDDSRPQLTEEFIAPRTAIEELVAQVWKEVLNLEKIGVHDNFFHLGGHSLLSTRVLARVRDIFQKDVSLRDFFERPTVAALTEKVEEINGNRRRSLPLITRTPRREAFPLSLSQKQLLMMDQLLPGTFFLNMPYAFRLIGSLDIEVLKGSLQEIVRRHEAFQMVFRERNGRPVQFVGPVPKIELLFVDLRYLLPKEADKEFARISTDDAELPFDLEKGPPFRIQLIRVADQEHVLLVTVHHIVCDQWSMQVFRRELILLYEAFSQGLPSPLPEVSVQFVDFVCWQRNLLKRGLLKKQLSYWKKQLASPLPSLKFHKSRRRKTLITFGTSNQAMEVDENLLTGLKKLAREENCTPFMVLLAVLDIVLYLHTGQADVLVGTTVANRSRREIEGTIGNCLNAIILRAHLSREITFKQFLAQVKEMSLGALANQELPLGHLARALGKEQRNKRDCSLFQVMFIYQNRTFEPVQISGLTFASWDGKYRRAEPDVIISMLDLIFDMREASTKLTGCVTYKTAIVDHEFVTDIIASFYRITERVLGQPNQSISDILNDVPPKAV